MCERRVSSPSRRRAAAQRASFLFGALEPHFFHFYQIFGMADIFHAAGEGNLARVEELLAQGGLDLAAFEPGGGFKLTALYRAARGGHLDVAEALIHAGAPLSVPNETLSPLHGAVEGSHHDVASMLLRKGAELDVHSNGIGTPLAGAKDRSMAALLIAAGADVNHAGPIAPLHMAAIRGNLEVLQELLSHPSITVNIQDGGPHRTPLHLAARWYHSVCVAALLAAGADACITDAKGHTPLRSCFTDNEGYSEFRIIAMLVAAGDRQWAYVPSPCPGLELALRSVWTEAPQELPQLAARLEPGAKRRIQAVLCVLHHASPRHLPEAIRMQLLGKAFKV
jgi:hypothetical protein